MNEEDMIMIAQITSTHGVRGDLKIKSYLANPENLEGYETYDEYSQKIRVEIKRWGKKDLIIVSLNNINDMDEAKKFINKKLFVKRQDLPELEEDEYYYHDIIGAEIYKDGKSFGKVKDMHNHGAGELLEIQKLDGKIEVFNFDDDNFSELDLKMRIIYMN